MAESVLVADNVELVANNIQDKVGATLLGTKNLAADAVGVSEPVIGVLDSIRTLQTSAVEKLSELVEVMKAQFTFDKTALRQTNEQEEQAKTKKGSGSTMASLSDWFKNLDMKQDMKGMGLAGMAAGFTSMLGKMLFSSVTGLITGLVLVIFDGFAGMKQWGGVSGFIGGLFGGLHSGLKGAVMQAGKFALIGGSIGMMFFGPLGMLIGGLIGALIGGIAGWFGGEKIAAFLKNIAALPTMMMEKIVEVFTNIKDAVKNAVTGYIDWYVGLVKAIFKPISSVLKKIINSIKGVMIWAIDQLPDWGPLKKKKEEWKKKLESEPTAQDEVQEDTIDKVETLATSTESVKNKLDKGEEVLSGDVDTTLKASDDMAASLNAEDLKTDVKYAKFVMKNVATAAEDLMRLAKSEGISPADAKKLEARALALTEKLATVQTELNQVKGSVIIGKDGKEIEVLNADQTNEMQNEIKELNLDKLAYERIIAELENKDEDNKGLSRKDQHALDTAKEKLVKTKTDMADINSILGEQINVAKLKDDKTFDDTKHMKIKSQQLDLKEPDKDTKPVTITKVDGSPTIATNKHISMIEHKGIFPVDPTMMAALAGYSK